MSQSLLSDDELSMNSSFRLCSKSRLCAGFTSRLSPTLTSGCALASFTVFASGCGDGAGDSPKLFVISSRRLRSSDLTSAPLISDRKLVGFGGALLVLRTTAGSLDGVFWELAGGAGCFAMRPYG